VNNTTFEDSECDSENCGEYPNREGVVRKGLPRITYLSYSDTKIGIYLLKLV